MKRLLSSIVLCVLIFLTGCRMFALILPPIVKDVPAEYPYLYNKKVAVVVHTEQETLAVYPHVQWEIADHVRTALQANVRGITVIDPEEVAQYQRQNTDWASRDPARVGQDLGVDRLIEVQLTEYTTREPESPYMYRGHITAALRVYNVAYLRAQPAFRKEVRTIHPPDGPGAWGTTDREIRAATMETFGLDVAGLFYDRTIEER
ncbi:MAG: hypothetical protein IPM18_11410 [Phycisphaerales bacterium]|nr:hypothetical protein [Phycisphaerales bacterium]